LPDDTTPIEAPIVTDFDLDEASEVSALSGAGDHVEEIPTTEQVAELTRELLAVRERAARLDNRVFQMRTLLQSGKGFSEILNIQSLLDAFMAVCRERYDVRKSTVLLVDDLDPHLAFYRIRGYHGLPHDYVDGHGHTEPMLMYKIPHDQGMLWQVVHQGHVFSVRDLEGKPRFKTASRHWRLETLEADVWVPLIHGSEVLGILTLGPSGDGSQIPEEEFDFLEEIAAVAATNIDSTLKYEKNSRILSNLRTLYDINQQLANVNDFKQLSIDTLSTAVRALSAQKANLMLYNPDTERLEIKVVWGNIPTHVRDAINDGRMETKSFAMGEGVAGQAGQLRKPVRMNNRAEIKQVGHHVVYCILAAPLIYGGEVVGVMTLTNKVKKDSEGELEMDTLGRFGEEDEALLRSLSDQAAVNLHKARLYSASITDRLTGLYNARHFESRLDGSIADALMANKELSLAVTDIDHFKRFNDTYGHQAGDFVLAGVARLLREAVRENTTDASFRYGGEEFCLLMPATGPADALAVADEYRQRIEDTEFEYEGQVLRVTVSIGLSTCPKDAQSRVTLFERADQALYASKEGGRNRCTTYDPRVIQGEAE
jgi:diguanylate cyclase (GGDEF)-like protein